MSSAFGSRWLVSETWKVLWTWSMTLSDLELSISGPGSIGPRSIKFPTSAFSVWRAAFDDLWLVLSTWTSKRMICRTSYTITKIEPRPLKGYVGPQSKQESRTLEPEFSPQHLMIDNWLLELSPWQLKFGVWQLVIGHWSSALNNWSSVFDNWWLATRARHSALEAQFLTIGDWLPELGPRHVKFGIWWLVIGSQYSGVNVMNLAFEI